jgi:hypothetical protein
VVVKVTRQTVDRLHRRRRRRHRRQEKVMRKIKSRRYDKFFDGAIYLCWSHWLIYRCC